MFRNLRTFSSFSRSLFRPRSSLLQHDGAVIVRRVRVVRPIFTPRFVEYSLLISFATKLICQNSRIRIVSSWVFSVGAFYYIVGSLDDEEEEAQRVVQSKALTTSEQLADLESQQDRDESDAEDEQDEDIVPDTIPEDAWFIPLGFARERPQAFYRGSDPEWQSFVDFAKDKNKNVQIRRLSACPNEIYTKLTAS